MGAALEHRAYPEGSDHPTGQERTEAQFWACSLGTNSKLGEGRKDRSEGHQRYVGDGCGTARFPRSPAETALSGPCGWVLRVVAT
jgi:hypothetical protein